MHPEALILRRCYPVPVTFADLRAAYVAAYDVRWRFKSAFLREWHSMLKAQTGALDEVYAVVDGRETQVAMAKDTGAFAYNGCWADIVKSHEHISDLLSKADREDYWARPHEVRLELQRREP